MTKKDYILVANAFQDCLAWMRTNEWFDSKDKEAVKYYNQQLITRLGQYFLGNNAKYSHKKFTEFINQPLPKTDNFTN